MPPPGRPGRRARSRAERMIVMANRTVEDHRPVVGILVGQPWLDSDRAIMAVHVTVKPWVGPAACPAAKSRLGRPGCLTQGLTVTVYASLSSASERLASGRGPVTVMGHRATVIVAVWAVVVTVTRRS